MAHFVGCGIDYLPLSYLAPPLGRNFKSKVGWDPIVERFSKKLAWCKSKLLYKGGGFTLLKRTLWSLPIYFASLFTILASISDHLEKIMRDFLWTNNETCSGFH